MRAILTSLAIVAVGCAGTDKSPRGSNSSAGVPVVVEPPTLSERARNKRLQDAQTPKSGLNAKLEGGVVR